MRVLVIPRPPSRGLIEALAVIAATIRKQVIPRPPSRGLIEAFQAAASSGRRAVKFRDLQVAASLKPNLSAKWPAQPAGNSATSKSRPH